MENIEVVNFTDLSLSQLLEIFSNYLKSDLGIKLDYYSIAEYGVDIRIIDTDSDYVCTYFLTFNFNGECISQECEIKLNISKGVSENEN